MSEPSDTVRTEVFQAASPLDPPAIPPAHKQPWATWVAVFKSTRTHIKTDRVNVAAGSLAYRWFLSLFPIVIALLGVSAIADIPKEAIKTISNGVVRALPAGASDVLTRAITQAQHRPPGALTATIVAALIAIWSATSGMAMLQEGLDMAYEMPSDRRFVAKRIRGLPLIGAAIVLGGSATALVVFGEQLGTAISTTVPFGSTVFLALWTTLRWAGALALMGLLFAVFYYLGPSSVVARWQWLSPGALVATILWAFASLMFSFYTAHFGSYGKTYGAFAGVAVLILWLYITALAILIGAEINAAIDRLRSDNPDAEATK